MTAVWSVGGWLALCALAIGAWSLGHGRGWRKGLAEREQWQALCDEVGDELVDARAELAKADATIEVLHRNIDVAWQAGIYHGQKFGNELDQEGLR